MIHTDGRPTIANARVRTAPELEDARPVSHRDPGDENDAELQSLRRRVKELEAELSQLREQRDFELDSAYEDWPPAEPVFGGY